MRILKKIIKETIARYYVVDIRDRAHWHTHAGPFDTLPEAKRHLMNARADGKINQTTAHARQLYVSPRISRDVFDWQDRVSVHVRLLRRPR